MIVHREISQLPSFKNTVLTIGSFDGVHKGHLKILQQVIDEAKKVNGDAVVITFYPHPKNIITPSHATPSLLTSFDEKVALINKIGLDHLVVIPFDKNFSEVSAQDFIVNFLVNKFTPHSIIIGHDHRFGKDRMGDFNMLNEYALKYNFSVIQIPEHVLENITISSTAIRTFIKSGNIEGANELLGYSFQFTGIVTHGKKMGRTLGFPTANIKIMDDDKLIPAEGVYAVFAQIEDSTALIKGMMNIGRNPTFDEKDLKIEVNLFDFNDDLYNKKITIQVIKKIREEIKFKNLESLSSQLLLDKEAALYSLL